MIIILWIIKGRTGIYQTCLDLSILALLFRLGFKLIFASKALVNLITVSKNPIVLFQNL
jgi:hypothetical protein